MLSIVFQEAKSKAMAELVIDLPGGGQSNAAEYLDAIQLNFQYNPSSAVFGKAGETVIDLGT